MQQSCTTPAQAQSAADMNPAPLQSGDSGTQSGGPSDAAGSTVPMSASGNNDGQPLMIPATEATIVLDSTRVRDKGILWLVEPPQWAKQTEVCQVGLRNVTSKWPGPSLQTLTLGNSTLPLRFKRHTDELERAATGVVVSIYNVDFEVTDQNQGFALTDGFARVFTEKFGCPVWKTWQSGVPTSLVVNGNSVFTPENYPSETYPCGIDAIKLFPVENTQGKNKGDFAMSACDPDYYNLVAIGRPYARDGYVYRRNGMGSVQALASMVCGANADFVKFPTFYHKDHIPRATFLNTRRSLRHVTQSANACNREPLNPSALFWWRQARRIAHFQHKRRKDPLYCARVYNNAMVLMGPKYYVSCKEHDA
jgi:hypothetical protein